MPEQAFVDAKKTGTPGGDGGGGGAGRRVPSHSNRSGWIGIHIIWHLPSVYYVSGPIPGTSFNDYYNIDNVAVAIPISDRY